MLKDKKEEKRLYDIEYRRKNKSKIVARKKKDYSNNKEDHKEKHKKYRSRPENVLRHNQYCMSEEYRAKKRIWDIIYRSMKYYGDFWEAAILLNQLEIEVRRLIPKKERCGYKRNVRAIINRNTQKRLEIAFFKIVHGDDANILHANWTDENKSILKELMVCHNF